MSGLCAATLEWQDIPFVGRTGYYVMIDGTIVADQVGTSYTFTDLELGANYTLAVQAHDAGSGTSKPISISYDTPSSSSFFALPTDRATVWNPGPLEDTLLGLPLDSETRLPMRTTIFTTVALQTGSVAPIPANNLTAIQNAVNSCPPGQVVLLPAGSYTIDISGTAAWGLRMPTGVVLRGAGRDAGGTSLSVIGDDSSGYMISTTGPGFGTGVSVTADVSHGATSIPVSSAATFAIGDLIMIDQLNDTYVVNPLPDSFNWNNAGRTVGQIVEVVGISGNNLIIYDPATGRGAPIHAPYKASLSPLVYRCADPYEYVGIEDIQFSCTVTPGNSNTMIIFLDGVRNSWVKNVELNRPGWWGVAVNFDRSFRCALRDSYIHDAATYSHGGGGYQVRLMWHTSETLVENNIVRHANKLMLMAGTGGGNVIGYNYFDWGVDVSGGDFQETVIDLGHASFPHYDLVEGNYAANVSTENVWGNQGWHTVFRNYLPGTELESSTWPASPDTTQGNISSVCFEAFSMDMSVVGNVVGTAGIGLVDWDISNATGWVSAVWRIGQSPDPTPGSDDKSTFEDPTSSTSTYSMMLTHGNYDNVAGEVSWDANTTNHNLPNSLYLTSKPAFYGSNPWPYVNPIGATDAERVGYLPAFERWKSGNP